MKVLDNTPAVLSLGKLCDENGYSYEWINGQKPHLIKNGIRIICNTENFVPIVVPGLSSSSSGSGSSTSKETTIERGNPLCSDDSEIPEWLQEFSENLVDDEIPLQGGSHASSSHEASLEPTTKRREDLGKQCFVLISPNTEISTSVKRPKLQGPRADNAMAEPYLVLKNFGDLITADHKVLSDKCESPNNHRYAGSGRSMDPGVSVQKTPQETQRSLQKFLEPERKPKVIYTDNSLEFGEACEDLSWNHCTSTPHRSETTGIAERALRRVKERTSAVLLQ